MGPKPISKRLQGIRESVIREMTRLAERHDAINLAQGFPDFDPPEQVKEGAIKAIRGGENQYSFTWGLPELRAAVARKVKRFNGIDADPDLNVTITCGSTEAMFASILALANPGDEFIVLEPSYENYIPAILLAGARPRCVTLSGEDFGLDEEALKEAFGPRTKAIIVNTPHNPTGKVFDKKALRLIADLCAERGSYALTDEIYEHIIYDGLKHMSLAALGDMCDRTITISGISKSHSATGWRVGYVVAPAELTAAIRKVHDYMTVCAPTPLQWAALHALSLPESYYSELASEYERRRNYFVPALRELGFVAPMPQGAYYVLADFSALSGEDDVAFSLRLVSGARVAVVPGSSFYLNGKYGASKIRFAFCKQLATLREAVSRLSSFLAGRDGRGGDKA